MSRRSLGTLTLDLIARVGGFEAGMDKAARASERSSRRIRRGSDKATTAIKSLVAACSVGAVIAFTDRQLKAAQAVGQMADKAGIGTTQLQELRYAMTSLGSVTEGQVDVALERFNRRLGQAIDGSGAAKSAFEELFDGVEQFDSTDQALDAVIQALAGVESESRRSALAAKFFGNAVGADLAAALEDGTASLDDMRQRAHDLGIVLDEDLVRNADKVRSEFEEASHVLSVQFMRAVVSITPHVLELSNAVAGLWKSIKERAGYDGGPFDTELKHYGDQVAFLTSQIEETERKLQRVGSGAEGLLPDALLGKRRKVLFDQLARLNLELVAAQHNLDHFTQKREEALSGGGLRDPITIEIGDPKAIADLRAQIADQERLNAAALQGAGAVKELTDEIKRRDEARKHADDLSEEELAAYDKLYARLQALKITQDENTKAVEAAAKVKRDLAGRLGEYNEQLELLDDLLDRGLLSWDEYTHAVAKATNELEDVGKTGNQSLKDIELAIQGFGRSFEDTIVQAAKAGKLSFADMTNAILEDILRIVLRAQIIRPILQGLDGNFGLNLTANADGNIISQGKVVPFAKGGVVDGPTLFPMAGNNTGLMGEAGPEAIMPLMRGKDGKLGVKADVSGAGGGAVVQIIDQRSGGQQPQVEQSRGPDGRQISRVLIRDEVKAALSGGAPRVAA